MQFILRNVCYIAMAISDCFSERRIFGEDAVLRKRFSTGIVLSK